MTYLKSLFSQAFLAAALLAGAGAANAGAVYHVDIKTAGFDTSGGDTAYLEMYFAPFGSADPLTATLSKLQGAFLEEPTLNQVTVGPDGTLRFMSDFATDYLRLFKLGQDISFDISFDGLPSDIGTASFSADLIKGDYSDYLSHAVTFTLQSDSIGYVTDPGVASVGPAAADVPEPSAAALVLIGLMMAGAVARRRA